MRLDGQHLVTHLPVCHDHHIVWSLCCDSTGSPAGVKAYEEMREKGGKGRIKGDYHGYSNGRVAYGV